MNNTTPVENDPSEVNSPDVMTEKGEETHSIPLRTYLLEIFQTLILAAVMYVMIDAVIARVRVENISMLPTLHPGEFLLVNKIAYKINAMSRGDIVIFHHDEKEDYIKRLIGLPGDVVIVKDGKVTVNNQTLNEPYIAAPPSYTGEWQVPAGSVFVLGDNRNSSSDSHSWGFVSLDRLIGKALVVYWPPQNMQILTHPDIVSATSGSTP